MRVIVGLVFFINFCFANIGQVTALVGDASINRAGQIFPAKLGAKIENKDIIKTQENSKLQIIFTDNTIVTVGKSSALDIADYLFDEQQPQKSKTKLNFFKGSFKTITGQIGKINKKRFKLKTKTASIGIRGTFIVGNQNMIACIQGGISVQNEIGQVDVDSNQFTLTQKDKPPTPPQTLTQQNLQNLQNQIEPKKKEQKRQGDKQAPPPKGDNKGDNPPPPKNDAPPPPPPPPANQQGEPTQGAPNQADIQQLVNDIGKNSQGVNNQNNNDRVNEVVNNATQDTVLSFEGKVQGQINYYGDDASPIDIIQDSTNQVLLNFDIGGGKSNMTGSMKFTGTDIETDSFNYTLDSSNANLNNSSFNANIKHDSLNDTQSISLKGNSNSVSTESSKTIEGANGHSAKISFTANKK